MRALRIVALLLGFGIASAASAGGRAAADVVVTIDKASQRMAVAVNGRTRYVWPVSTGRSGYGTPSGNFRPQWMARTYFSKKYYDSPMPHSIFFYHGYAIHGTDSINRLGGPASHGCVRLHPSSAATLFALVQRYGMDSTRIVIGDSIALQRAERWSARDEGEVKFISRMTDRLMLAEQIERKEALTRMEQMRASDALRRILDRGARNGAAADDEPQVAIGVQAHDRAAVPVPVLQSLPSAKVPSPAARPKPAGKTRTVARVEQAAPGKSKRQAVQTQRTRRVEPKPGKPPLRAEQPKRQRVSAWWAQTH